MAKALAFSMLKKNVLSPSNIHVSGPNLQNLQPWRNVGVNNISDKNYDTVCNCQIIFICVKPQYFKSMASSLEEDYEKHPVELKDKVWVSIMAGVTLDKIKDTLGFYPSPKIIRTMPNTPVDVGAGVIVYTPGGNVTQDEAMKVRSLLQAISLCQEIPESIINSASALSGSGPAYIYQVIEALADGGVKMGIPRHLANQFAAQTVLGAAQMVLKTGKHPGLLKDEVCSPGGSTIAGVHELEKSGVRNAFMNAVQAAKMRNDELGKQN
ncbi:pyrroline-5-carboxylate reductase 3-like [Ctenocephalides felis]|uniref:pyrroline-5-carboxylate reductase 3-like n=1 Tax=Ctenocephalides felis TaxID=7515 RepID=UPI000E6E5846|nr:pyrroline-5-carboxylate reductase 3-like [Ctenocephalides felis]